MGLSIKTLRINPVTVATSATALLTSSTALNAAAQTHRLQPGETLSAVARKFHVSVQDLKVANHLANVDSVPDYKRLIIPPRPHHLRVEPVLDRSGRVKADRVSLRLGPGEDYRRIDYVDIGSHLTVTALRQGWAQVRLSGDKMGWLRHDFVAYTDKHTHEHDRQQKLAHAAPDSQRHKHAHHPHIALEHRAAKHTQHEQRLAEQARMHRRHLAEAEERRHKLAEEARRRAHDKAIAALHRHSHKAAIASGRHHPIHLAANHGFFRPPTPSPRPLLHHSRQIDRQQIASRDIVRTAFAYRGTPYVYGGEGRRGFDCSGFTSYLYSRRGVALPHSARAQFGMGHHVGRAELKPGDLVFFHTVTPGISHVGMYVGSGRFVHASSRRDGGVRVDNLSDGYYSRAFRGARRILKNSGS